MPELMNLPKLFCVIIITQVIVEENAIVTTRNKRISREIRNNTTRDYCRLPLNPSNGNWSTTADVGDFSPGTLVPENTKLTIHCNDEYTLFGENTTVCAKTSWTPALGTCLKTCPPIRSPFVFPECDLDGRPVNCTNALNGTTTKFSCHHPYEVPNKNKKDSAVCINGIWVENIPSCVPVCGSRNPPESTIIKGTDVKKGDFPWQAAIYDSKTKKLICGGTVLSDRLILTAAHCITESPQSWRLKPNEDFEVAVGKYYQQYNDPRDLNGTQYSTISDMFVPKKYKADVQNYVGDIAVIVTSKTLEFSTRVQPVCVDWTNTYQHAISNPRRGQMGYVTGWGYTSQNAKQLSDNLKSLTVPLVNEDDCYRNVPENFIQFLTDDKLCAGFLKSGMSLCQGDSGGGLVVKFENRYHIAAVASLGVLSETGGGECDSSQYNVYTLFADYIDFVSDKLAQYPPLGSEGLLISKSDFPRCVTTDTSTITNSFRSRCVLPEHPNFGRWSTENGSLLPGMSVPAGTTLDVECDDGYVVDGNNRTSCQDQKWTPTVGTCSIVEPPQFVTISEIRNFIVEMSNEQLELWEMVNNNTFDKQNIFARTERLLKKVNDIDQKLDNILISPDRMLTTLSEEDWFMLNMNKLQTMKDFVDDNYEELSKYLEDKNSTIMEFVKRIVSPGNSTSYYMNELKNYVVAKDFLQPLHELLKPITGSMFCYEHHSSQQMLYNFLNDILLTNVKNFVLEQFAYTIKVFRDQGNFTKEIQATHEKFKNQITEIVNTFKPYITQASSELWRCDPQQHVPGKTYIEVTNFLHGYIHGEKNDKRKDCSKTSWAEQPECPKIVNCHSIDFLLTVYPSNMTESGRRYNHVEFKNGTVLGFVENCNTNSCTRYEKNLDCSPHFCLCEEKLDSSDRYVSLREIITNRSDNRVVTGVRFVKRNRIVHLQVQEGRLLPEGQIDITTIRWLPVHDSGPDASSGIDYHALTWEKRSVDLDPVRTNKGTVVTGVRFRYSSSLNLEILVTPFNFTTGELLNPRALRVFKESQNAALRNRFGSFGKELVLDRPDIPTRFMLPSTDHTVRKFVRFGHTDFVKDAGQTTVPFFDAQPVTATVPLSGIGIYHKGRSGSGGFIAPKIFTYNFANHLQPIF